MVVGLARGAGRHARARRDHVRVLRRRGVRGRASRVAAPSTSTWSPSIGEHARSTRRCATRSRAEELVALGDGHRGPGRRRQAPGAPRGSHVGNARRPRPRPGRGARRAGRARSRPHVDPALRRARRGAGRHRVGVHRGVRPAAAHGDLRCGRLHARARQRGQGPRLPRRRVRRAGGVRDPPAVPDGRRGRERVAQPLPREGRRRPGPARRGVRAHPRQQVRRPRHRRLAGDACRLPRRDGFAQDPRQAHRAAARGGRHRRRARPHPRTDRPRHRCPHPGGDRGVHLRRDHRGPHRSRRRRPCATRRGRSTRELRHRGPTGRGRGGVERAGARDRAGAGRRRCHRRHLQPGA